MNHNTYEPLTERELVTLRLMAQGKTNQQIANTLSLALDSIKKYNTALFNKLDVTNRTQAVNRARELGLFDPVYHLPMQDVGFIGRERELLDLKTRLAQSDQRLLTLHGPGGIGKTQLALALAYHVQEDFADGVYFVDLAAMESVRTIEHEVATTIGIGLSAQSSPRDAIVHYLRSKSLLLILDNYEHLLPNTDFIVGLLRETRYLKLVVTSREVLWLNQEQVITVRGLSFPSIETIDAAVVDIFDYAAPRLFLQSALRRRGDFAPTIADQIAIARICALTDGMPLALRLAAPWVTVMPCMEIEKAIRQDLNTLDMQFGDMPPRHQGMHAVIEHSWQMLSPGQQKQFYDLTIFASGFSAEAAQSVAGVTLAGLYALHNKAFLQSSDQRFTIHPLMKQYGQQKLRAQPDRWFRVAAAHCTYFTTFLDQRLNASNTGATKLQTVEQVYEDIIVAWRFAVQQGQHDAIARLVAGIMRYHTQQSWYRITDDASALYHQALHYFDADNPAHRNVLANIHQSLGHIYELPSNYDRVRHHFEQALAFVQSSDDETTAMRQAALLRHIARALVFQHEYEVGEQCYLEAETLLQSIDQRDMAWWHEWCEVESLLLELYYWTNDLNQMIAIRERIQSIIETHGTVRQRLQYLRMCVYIAARRDRYYHSEEALVFVKQTLHVYEEIGDLREVALAVFGMGFYYLFCDRFTESEATLLRSLKMAEENNDQVLRARVLTYLTTLYRRWKHIDKLTAYLDDALLVTQAAEMRQYTGCIHAQYGWLAWRAGDFEQAWQYLRVAQDDWDSLTMNALIAVRWLGLLPLLALSVDAGNYEMAVDCAEQMLDPAQQRLPDDLTHALKGAVDTWSKLQNVSVKHDLQRIVRVAQELDYL